MADNHTDANAPADDNNNSGQLVAPALDPNAVAMLIHQLRTQQRPMHNHPNNRVYTAPVPAPPLPYQFYGQQQYQPGYQQQYQPGYQQQYQSGYQQQYQPSYQQQYQPGYQQQSSATPYHRPEQAPASFQVNPYYQSQWAVAPNSYGSVTERQSSQREPTKAEKKKPVLEQNANTRSKQSYWHQMNPYVSQQAEAFSDLGFQGQYAHQSKMGSLQRTDRDMSEGGVELNQITSAYGFLSSLRAPQQPRSRHVNNKRRLTLSEEPIDDQPWNTDNPSKKGKKRRNKGKQKNHKDGNAESAPYLTLEAPTTGGAKGKEKNKKGKAAAVPFAREAAPSPPLQAPTAFATVKATRHRLPNIPRPVPVPTEMYMSRASFGTMAGSQPRHLLVILDLNGTLVFRPKRSKSASIVKRPFVKEFLEYIFSNFSVMIWSSARPDNVLKMVEQVLDEDQRKKLVAQWSRDNLGLTPNEYAQKVQVFKQLSWVWGDERIQRQHPGYGKGERWGQHDTVLIDDTQLKAAAEPYNLVEIPEFEGRPEQMQSDILREVAGYLEVAKWNVDVSAFIYGTPFKADGRFHMDWPGDVEGGISINH